MLRGRPGPGPSRDAGGACRSCGQPQIGDGFTRTKRERAQPTPPDAHTANGGCRTRLGGWIPRSIPAESQAVIRDIQRYGVEAQGAGGQRMGPIGPETFRNDGETGGCILPTHDSSGKAITYREWGTVQSRDNPNPGRERIVTGSDGSVYYSPTHYQTFIVAVPGS
ncbi:ribonuclease domain-containing protein [Micromonospora sp. NPDC047548]|uniref:ribonuclease domain-containing protein n=1 Tax=Micromonospora sp. NPDC047548 TaxID=3155624 RepID=UPI0033EC394D